MFILFCFLKYTCRKYNIILKRFNINKLRSNIKLTIKIYKSSSIYIWSYGSADIIHFLIFLLDFVTDVISRNPLGKKIKQ